MRLNLLQHDCGPHMYTCTRLSCGECGYVTFILVHMPLPSMHNADTGTHTAIRWRTPVRIAHILPAHVHVCKTYQYTYLDPVLMKFLREEPLWVVVALPPRATTTAVIMALLPPARARRGERWEFESSTEHMHLHSLPLLPSMKLTFGERVTSSLRWHIKSVS